MSWLLQLGGNMVVSQNKGDPNISNIHYSPCYRDPQAGILDFGKPLCVAIGLSHIRDRSVDPRVQTPLIARAT